MTKLTSTPKVSQVIESPNVSEFTGVDKTPASSTNLDDYVPANSSTKYNKYKSMVSGYKAGSDSLSGSLLDTLDEIEQAQISGAQAEKDPMQAFISQNLMMGAPAAKNMKKNELPYVPKLESIFKETPGSQGNMKPIVDRYSALKKDIEARIMNMDASLDPSNMTNLSVHEIVSLRELKTGLEDSLKVCNDELKKAEYLYKWEQKNVAESAAQEAGDAAKKATETSKTS